jgi:1D-myo-inositol 3-kinase
VDLLVLGHVTRDEVAGAVRLGGGASYAALAAARLGFETALVTVAPPDDPLLAPLRQAARLTIHCAPSEVMTTFALDYAGPRRRLALRRRARALAPADVPAHWLRPAVAYVGPVAAECDGQLVCALDARFVGAGLQGWLRRIGEDGWIAPAIAPALSGGESPEAQDPPRLDVAVVSEEDHPGAEGVAAMLVGRGTTVAITRAARGATLTTPTRSIEVPAAPAHEVDPTGAGDVFGVVLTLALAGGASLADAGRTAAEAAARVVEGPGLGRLGLAGPAGGPSP